MIICLEHLFNKENLMLMKNLFPSRVIVCVITLLTLTFPVFAQTTNATDEYEETAAVFTTDYYSIFYR